ncbi:MAG TPA: helix-turn-helix transcriptional regulator [Armatimonadota bacterium]|jgi:predicted XRE-type DNA-binding protein
MPRTTKDQWKGPQVQDSCGIIYEDLGLPNAEDLLAKTDLAIRIKELIQQRGMTQAQAAERMGVAQPDVSNIVRGKLESFGLERLITCVVALGQEVQLRMPPDRVSREPARLLVTR